MRVSTVQRSSEPTGHRNEHDPDKEFDNIPYAVLFKFLLALQAGVDVEALSSSKSTSATFTSLVPLFDDDKTPAVLITQQILNAAFGCVVFVLFSFVARTAPR